jgi:hypothetical protein
VVLQHKDRHAGIAQRTLVNHLANDTTVGKRK